MNRSMASTCLGPAEADAVVAHYGDEGWTVAAMGYVPGQGYWVAMNREDTA